MADKKEAKSTLSGVLDGVLSTGVGSMLMTVLGLVGFMITSRVLPKDELGAFVILQLVTNFLVGLSGFGLELSITKFLAETKDEKRHQQIIGNVVVFRLVTIVLFSGLALLVQRPLFELFGGSAYIQVVTYIPFMLLLESLSRLIDSVFGGVFAFKWIGISTSILSIINLVLIIVLVAWQGLGLEGRIWARMIAVGSSILVAVIFTRLNVKMRLNLKLLGEMLRFSFPLYINFLLTFLFQRADTFIIGGFMGPVEIAIYEIARKIPESIESLYDAFRKVYFPFISDLFGQKRYKEASGLLNHSLRLVAVAGVFGVLVSFFFGREIIFLLFSDAYEQSVLLFGVLMILLLMNVIDYTLGYSLVAVGDSSRPAMINVVHTVLNFIGYYALIPISGIFGVALANLTGVTVVNPVNVFFLRRKKVKARVGNYLVPILIGALLVGAFFVFDLEQWYLRIALIVGYFALCFLFGIVSIRDIREFVNQIKRFRGKKQEMDFLDNELESNAVEKNGMSIVYVASVYPYPPNSGHRIRNYNLLKRLGEKNNLHLRLLVHEAPSEEDLLGLAPFVKSLRYYVQPEIGAFAKPFKGIAYWLRGIPPDLRFSMNQSMMEELSVFFRKNHVDILQIEDPAMALYVQAVPAGQNVKKVLTFHDINFKKFERIANLEPSLKRKLRLMLHSRMMRTWEPKFSENFDLCVTMSDVDKALLSSANANLRIQSIPNGVDTVEFEVLEENDSKLMYHILFVGNMDYRPNIEAVNFFVKQVMPLLDKDMPNYVFWIVGINPRDEVMALRNEKIHVTGRVPDVHPYYENAQVVVVPLFAGGGTRLKILEALSLGRPVVSTTIGAEGLDLIPGEHILIADTPQDFHEAIEALVKDPAFRENLVLRGRDCVVSLYDWDAIADTLEKLYLSLIR